MDRDVLLDIDIDPIFWEDPPKIRIGFNGQILAEQEISTSRTWSWRLPAQDDNRLSVWMLNKVDRDSTEDGRDKAVIIRSVGIEGLRYDSFLHATRYRPIYSQGYYDYAQRQGLEVSPVIHSNYLGFNGEWYLEFTWPTFEWIYNLETSGLGWVYEKNI